MLNYIEIKKILNELLFHLTGRDEWYYKQIKLALKNDQSLIEYLQSNELWGGSGSLADQAGIERPSTRYKIESLLIQLGEEQKKINIVNQRTELWIEAFKEWKRSGIRGIGEQPMSDDLQQRILAILKQPGLACLATIDEQGKPWARYVIAMAADDMTLRCATFINARKVQHINNNPEVHLVAGVPDITHQTNYLQIQGKASISTEETEKNTFWIESMQLFFSGPDDPNYGVVIIKPYRIELWSGMQPEVWEAT